MLKGIASKIASKAALAQLSRMMKSMESRYGKEAAEFVVYASIEEGLEQSKVSGSARADAERQIASALGISLERCREAAKDAGFRERLASRLEADGLYPKYARVIRGRHGST